MTSPWKTLSSKIIFQNPWFELREDSVINPVGHPTTYTVIQTKGPSVFIIALNPQNKFPLVHVYRYVNNYWGWELPGGGSDTGEDPLTAARRELEEEAGLQATDWAKIGTFEPFSGVCDEWSHVFVARELIETQAHSQQEEGIDEVRWVSLEEALGLVRSGEIVYGQTIAALTLVKLQMNHL